MGYTIGLHCQLDIRRRRFQIQIKVELGSRIKSRYLSFLCDTSLTICWPVQVLSDRARICAYIHVDATSRAHCPALEPSHCVDAPKIEHWMRVFATCQPIASVLNDRKYSQVCIHLQGIYIFREASARSAQE